MKDKAKWAGIAVVILLAAFGGMFVIGEIAGKTDSAIASKPAKPGETIETRVSVAEKAIVNVEGDIVELKEIQVRSDSEHKDDIIRIHKRFDDFQTQQTNIMTGVQTLVDREKDGG